MCVVVALADGARGRSIGGTARPPAAGIAGAQREGRIRALMGHYRAAITGQLGVAVLEALPAFPLTLETGDVFPVAAVGPLPGLGHLGMRQPRVGPSAYGEP